MGHGGFKDQVQHIRRSEIVADMGKKYSHLDQQERIVIQMQLKFGFRPAEIAAELGRSRSTIMREMRRNGCPGRAKGGRLSLSRGYDPLQAHRRAQRLARKPRVRRKLVVDSRLWKRVVGLLGQGLSPAQIARTLGCMADADRLCYETIYTTLYAMPRGQLRSGLLKLMRRKHHARRPQRGKKGPLKPPIPEMTLIDHRPSEIEKRLIPGHWEGDLIIGKGNLSQVGVLVERATLFVVLVKLPDSKADTVVQAFSTILNRFTSQLRRSLTFDQGSEMRQHKQLTENTGVKVYFAHAHSPWERGICENTNGLLRQYLPKGTDLSVHTQDHLDAIGWQMNTRPRKSLGWAAPAELFLPKGAFNFTQYWSSPEVLTAPILIP
jgi:transposase, IS30 family